MDDILTRFVNDLLGRIQGPMNIRLICQPLVAVLYAVWDGIRDGRDGRVPYLYALFTTPGHRRALLRSGWKSAGRVFIMAIVVDIVYQVIVLRWFYPLEAIVTAAVLAFVPYLLIRGIVTRIYQRFH